MACVGKLSSQISINLISKNGVMSRKAQQHPWLSMDSSTSKRSRVCMCMSLPVTPPTTAVVPPAARDNGSLLTYPRQSTVISPKDDETIKIEELKEKTREALRRAADPTTTMELIDTIQRLGIGYSLEEEIDEVLKNLPESCPNDDLYTVALRFRLLRHNGLCTNADVFQKFMDANGKFKESLNEDTEGLLSLYEASYLGTNGEDILSHAKEFTTSSLKKSVSQLSPKLCKKVLQSLELPRHLRMARLEARRYIEEYGNEEDHNPILLELAKFDYNQVQSLHQMELAEITRWWKHLGLVSKLGFARDRPLECFLWTVGLMPEPKHSGSRIELAKTIAILLVLDDIFDTYGNFDDLVLFTEAIRRWDLNEMEKLPEYMKICYMALYNTTNEICYKVLKEHGWSVLPFLRRTWIDMVEAFMVEAEWVKKGSVPNLEDYIENGVTTAGSYMALVHLFFLIGDGVTDQNARELLDPYPHLFSKAGRILRLWDDLGTSKEEQERGDVASSIQLFMREKNITCEEEGRKEIVAIIHGLWKDLNGVLVAPGTMPLSIVKVALNMSRASQVVYQHDEDSYLSSVDNYVQSLFFTPINV